MKLLNTIIVTSSLLLAANVHANVQDEVEYNGVSVSKNVTSSELLLDSNDNTRKLYIKNPDFFKTSERIKADIEAEEILLQGFKDKVLPRKEYMKEADYNYMMNDYFVNALNSGHRNLADLILFDSGTKIDLNFMSKSPIKNPLLAIATNDSYDGGDVEYFIKLVKLGANPSFLTNKNKISIMGMAATVDNYKIVLYLTTLGENPMHLDNYEYYPLDYAVRNDSYKSILILTNVITEYKKQLELKRTE